MLIRIINGLYRFAYPVGLVNNYTTGYKSEEPDEPEENEDSEEPEENEEPKEPEENEDSEEPGENEEPKEPEENEEPEEIEDLTTQEQAQDQDSEQYPELDNPMDYLDWDKWLFTFIYFSVMTINAFTLYIILSYTGAFIYAVQTTIVSYVDTARTPNLHFCETPFAVTPLQETNS